MFLLLAALMLSDSVWADANNPFILPMGEREALNANSGLTIKGSPANLLYNPAGLTHIDGQRISVSGTTYAIAEGEIDQAFGSDTLSFSSFSAVPNMLVGSRKWRDWTYAFGLFVPIEIEIVTRYRSTISELGGIADVQFNTQTQEQYVGLGAAKSFSNGWALGLSAFGYRFFVRDMTSLNVDPTTGNLLFSINSRKEQEVMSLLLVGGAQKKWGEDFTLGIRVMTPSLPVYTRSMFYNNILVDDLNNPSPATREVKTPKSKTEYKTPLDTAAGLSYEYRSGHKIGIDVAVAWPTQFTKFKNTDEETLVKTRTTLRGSLHGENRLSQNWSIFSGLQLNPSTPSQGESPANNYTGISSGLYMKEENTSASIGVYYLWSRTDRKILGPTPEDATQFKIYGMMVSTSITY